MPKINKPKKLDFTLKELLRIRKRILIIRKQGGLGDLLVHRMIFEDFKLLMPDVHISFACPKHYHDALSDHPFIDELIDSKLSINPKDYICQYDTSSACWDYEQLAAPLIEKNRSDIWAEHCGVTLTRHNMHINSLETEWAKSMLPKDRKTILFMPVSAMPNKNLDDNQVIPVVKELESQGYFVFSIHTKPFSYFPTIIDLNLRQWMSIISVTDYVISTDTAALHCAGGLRIPTVGIFSWADGKVLSKYYPSVHVLQKHRDEDPCWCGPCAIFPKCPKSKEIRKPCITEITSEMILNAFEKIK